MIKPKIATFDIETEDSLDVIGASGRILCYTVNDSHTDINHAFILGRVNHILVRQKIIEFFSPYPKLLKKYPELRDPKIVVYMCEDESKLLMNFIKFSRKILQPDIYTGWNVVGFDFKYMINRMKKHFKLPYEAISELKSVELALRGDRSGIRKDVLRMKGIPVLDLQSGYEKIKKSDISFDSLEYISNKELGVGKMPRKSIAEMYRNDPDKLLAYNIVDVMLTKMIDDKVGITNYFVSMSQLSTCDINEVFNNSVYIDSYFLSKLFGKYCAISKSSRKVREITGGKVFDPAKGIHYFLLIIDFKSLYPMIMLTFDMSPETKDPNGDLEAFNGVRFNSKKKGFVSGVIKELVDDRAKIQKLLAEAEPDSDEYYALYRLQETRKESTNSMFGALDCGSFRFVDEDVAEAITTTGQALIKLSKKVIEEMGEEIIAGDTDSLFIKIKSTPLRGEIDDCVDNPKGEGGRIVLPQDLVDKYVDYCLKRGKFLIEELQKKYTEVLLKRGCKEHFIEMKFEKITRKSVFTGVKKKHAHCVYYDEDSDKKFVNYIFEKGFQTRRGDAAVITKSVQKRLYDMFLKEDSTKDEVYDYLVDIYSNFESEPWGALGIPKTVRRPLSEYKVKAAHVKAAYWSNRNLGKKFKGSGDKLFYFYVKETPKHMESTEIIGLQYGDDWPKGVKIDYKEMMRVCLDKPLEGLMDIYGLTPSEIKSSGTQPSCDGYV